MQGEPSLIEWHVNAPFDERLEGLSLQKSLPLFLRESCGTQRPSCSTVWANIGKRKFGALGARPFHNGTTVPKGAYSKPPQDSTRKLVVVLMVLLRVEEPETDSHRSVKNQLRNGYTKSSSSHLLTAAAATGYAHPDPLCECVRFVAHTTI